MKSTYLARGGILTAITTILIYISSIAPTNKLSILTLASVIIPITVITTNIKTALLVYAASSILSIILLGLKMAIVFYILFFGIYGIFKYYIEKLKSIPRELILKLIVFNISFSILYFLYKNFFLQQIKFSFSIYIIMFVLQFIFLTYDYFLTLFISYFNKNILHK